MSIGASAPSGHMHGDPTHFHVLNQTTPTLARTHISSSGSGIRCGIGVVLARADASSAAPIAGSISFPPRRIPHLDGRRRAGRGPARPRVVETETDWLGSDTSLHVRRAFSWPVHIHGPYGNTGSKGAMRPTYFRQAGRPETTIVQVPCRMSERPGSSRGRLDYRHDRRASRMLGESETPGCA